MEVIEMLEDLLDAATYYYKKNIRKMCPLVSRMLDRHEAVQLFDTDLTCWREVAVYGIAQLLQEYSPESDFEIELDGNNSTLAYSWTPEEERRVVSKIYPIVKKWNS